MRDGDAQVFLLAMQNRLQADPRLALGLTPTANSADVRTAFLTLTKQYHPVKFARCDAAVQRLANEVFLLLREAHDVVTKGTRTAAGTSRTNAVGAASTTGPLRTIATTRTTGPTPVVGRTPSPQPATVLRTVGPTASANSASNAAGSAAFAAVKPAAAAPASANKPLSAAAPASASKPLSAAAAPASASKPPPAAAAPRPPTTATPVASAKPAVPAPASVSFRSAPPLAASPISPTTVDETELFTKGKELLRQKNWNEARDVFVALTRHNNGESAYKAMLALARGRIDQASGNLDGARTQFSLALQLEPAFSAAATALDEIGPVESKSSLWSKLRGK